MKNYVLPLIALASLTVSCARKHRPNDIVLPYSFISIDSANKMIGSYLNSTSGATGDTSLRSLIVNMDQIRLYDTCTGVKRIEKLEIKFAHTLEYINAGHGSQNAGYKSGALTVVLVGINSAGDYVYFDNGLVIDHTTACPYTCPPGTASNPLLPQTTSR